MENIWINSYINLNRWEKKKRHWQIENRSIGNTEYINRSFRSERISSGSWRISVDLRTAWVDLWWILGGSWWISGGSLVNLVWVLGKSWWILTGSWEGLAGSRVDLVRFYWILVDLKGGSWWNLGGSWWISGGSCVDLGWILVDLGWLLVDLGGICGGSWVSVGWIFVDQDWIVGGHWWILLETALCIKTRRSNFRF